MICTHIKTQDNVLGDCIFREVLTGTLKMPVYQVRVTDSGGTDILEGANGFLRVDGSHFVLELVAFGPESVLSTLGYRPALRHSPPNAERSAASASGAPQSAGPYRTYSLGTSPIGKLRMPETDGYRISGLTQANQQFAATTLDYRTSAHIAGQVHITCWLQTFDLSKDDTPAFQALVDVGQLPSVPPSSRPRCVAFVMGQYPKNLPTKLTVRLGGFDCDVERKEIAPSFTLLEATGATDLAVLWRAVELVHEAFTFVTGFYFYVLGRARDYQHAFDLTLWADGLSKGAVSGYRPIDKCNADDIGSAVNCFLKYFGFKTDSEGFRNMLLRLAVVGEDVQPVKEFVLYTSIEGLSRVLKASRDETQEQELKRLKSAAQDFVKNFDTESESLKAVRNRLLGHIDSMQYFTAKEKLKALFARNNLSWHERYGFAWGKMRNSSAHGEEFCLSQESVDNYLVSLELWHVLVLSELGYSGGVVRYGRTGSGPFPSTNIRDQPTHLDPTVEEGRRKSQKKSKGSAGPEM